MVSNLKYKESISLFEMILYADYKALDEECGDDYELSLEQVVENRLVNMSINDLCLNIIYATYLSTKGEERINKIYSYFQNELFEKIKLENVFKLGVEVLEDVDEFLNDWMIKLVHNRGKNNSRLLKEVFDYTDYKNYNNYVKHISLNHSSVILNIFDYLIDKNRKEEMVLFGNESLEYVDIKGECRNEIALYLAKYDEKNMEKLIIDAFESLPNIPNLLRIINNGYFTKYESIISKIVDENEKEEVYFLKFFMGDCEYCYLGCLNYDKMLGWTGSFIETALYLWVILLNKNYDSKLYRDLLVRIFDKLGFINNLLFLNNNYEKVFNKWKDNFELNNTKRYFDLLEDIIDKRVDAIMTGNFRKSYYKVAHLVVLGALIFDSNCLRNKDEFINKFHKKYSRRSAFRRELDHYSKLL